MSQQEIEEFLILADTKEDGFIYYKDFVDLLSN